MGVCDHPVCCAPSCMSVGSQNRRVGRQMSLLGMLTHSILMASRVPTCSLGATLARTHNRAHPGGDTTTTHGACRFGRAGRGGLADRLEFDPPTDPRPGTQKGGLADWCEVQHTDGPGPCATKGRVGRPVSSSGHRRTRP